MIEIDESTSQKKCTDFTYKLIELKNVEDSDRLVCPESILIMRRKPNKEVQEIR